MKPQGTKLQLEVSLHVAVALLQAGRSVRRVADHIKKGIYKTFFVVILSLFLFANCANNDSDGISDFSESNKNYLDTLYQYSAIEDLYGVDNIEAKLVWMRTYIIESFIEAYLASNNEGFLNLFVEHVENIFSLRDDAVGRKDFNKIVHPGWSVAHHYTLSKPVILYDDNGSPSLQVWAIAKSANHATKIDVSPSLSGKYAITVSNAFYAENIRKKTYSNLDNDTVESTINLDPEKMIRVEVLGSKIPSKLNGITFTVYPLVFHTHHSGNILAPIARFCALVRQGVLPETYRAVSEVWLRQIYETIQDYESTWEEHENIGFFRIPKSIPFWADGAPEPFNTLAEQGRLFLYLWEATNDEKAKNKVIKIINLFREYSSFLPDGALTWPYWHSEAYDGWLENDNISENTPVYPPYSWGETTHYAQYMIRFLVEIDRVNLFPVNQEISALRVNFERIWKNPESLNSSKPNVVANGIDGQGSKAGRDDVDMYGFLYLSQYDTSIYERINLLYESKFTNLTNIQKRHRNELAIAVYSWSLLARFSLD